MGSVKGRDRASLVFLDRVFIRRNNSSLFQRISIFIIKFSIILNSDINYLIRYNWCLNLFNVKALIVKEKIN